MTMAATAVFLFGAESLEEDFLATLENINKEVEEQKINADYTPSTVTVLRRQELEELGIQNLHEALTLIPGMESNVNHVGWREVTIRGVRNSNTYGFDKVKLLIDGVSVTSQLYGSVHYYLDFPAEQIERIEVVRGPASALYGSGAYSGAINVVTKLAAQGSGSSVFAYGDSYTHKTAGTKIDILKNGATLALDAYFQHSDKTIDSKASTNYNRDQHGTDSNGKSWERLEDYSVGLNFAYENFSWMTRLKRSDAGNFFGADEYAESKDDYGQVNRFLFSEMKYDLPLGESINLELKAGYNEYDFELISRGFPRDEWARQVEGVLVNELGQTPTNAQLFTTAFITEDKIYGYESKESSSYTGATLQIPVANHEIEIGYLGKTSRNLYNAYHQNFDQDIMITEYMNSGAPETDWTKVNDYEDQFVGKNLTRRLSAITVSDLIQFERMDLSFAFRQDDYNHFDPVTSSNLGLIYRLTDTSNVKIAYGKAFRVPSWIEYNTQATAGKVGNSDIDPESIETVELFWTYLPKPRHRLRVGGFYSRLTDVIDSTVDPDDIDEQYFPELIALQGNDNNDSYVNYPERVTQGIELEYEGKLDVKNRVAATLSYVTTKTDGLQPFYNTGDSGDAKDVPIPDTATWLANLVYTHAFTPSLTLASRGYYMGEKTQNASGETLDDFIDVTETLHYYITPDWQVALSVKNFLNQRHVVPSNWAFHEEGLPREERYYTLQVSARF